MKSTTKTPVSVQHIASSERIGRSFSKMSVKKTNSKFEELARQQKSKA